jgi:LacI family transcriptional regulator
VTGFSINTVSRALNSKPEIRTETKEKILETATRLGYRPNRLAKGLRLNKTGTIGVIVTDITNPFFGAVVKGAEEAAREHGYSIILQDTGEDYEREEEAIQVMLAEQVDGLLITPVQKRKGTIEELKRVGLPFVLLGRHFDDLETDYVVPDDVQGGFLATEHLIKQGHERIALINAPLYISSARERFQGYKKALNEHEIGLNEALLESGAVAMEDGYNFTKSLLAQNPQPTAVFAYSDFVALGVMKAIREAGLGIPEDIAVVGYDDVDFSSCLEVSLTTIRIPKKTLGEKAMETLREKMDKGGGKRDVEGHQEVKLGVRLLVRQST